MILLIEDEYRWASRFAKALGRIGEDEVVHCANSTELIDLIAADEQGEHRLICFDQDLASSKRGSDIVEQIKSLGGADRVLVGITSSTDPVDIELFRSAGAHGVASKRGLRETLPQALSALYRGEELNVEEAQAFRFPVGFICPSLLSDETIALEGDID